MPGRGRCRDSPGQPRVTGQVTGWRLADRDTRGEVQTFQQLPQSRWGPGHQLAPLTLSPCPGRQAAELRLRDAVHTRALSALRPPHKALIFGHQDQKLFTDSLLFSAVASSRACVPQSSPETPVLPGWGVTPAARLPTSPLGAPPTSFQPFHRTAEEPPHTSALHLKDQGSSWTRGP